MQKMFCNVNSMVIRFFHTTKIVLATDKNALSSLRKKTGYTFSNCKKALDLHGNDISKAEDWLNKQAQSLGWSKANKLEGRATAQGLVGVLIKKNVGAMVEVNCETDFVARNENFQKFVDKATKLCAQYSEMTEFDGDLWKLGFESEALKNLKLEDGKSLGDHLALLIGTVGENATIKRAICFKTNNDLQLSGYCHPETTQIEDGNSLLGKYGAIVAFSAKEETDKLQKQICQHIVGMNPKKIGEPNVDDAIENKDDETCLIYQEYLIDPNYMVSEILNENNIKVVDFQRYGCGEVINSHN